LKREKDIFQGRVEEEENFWEERGKGGRKHIPKGLGWGKGVFFYERGGSVLLCEGK
jgi:hypothetical protein